MRLALTIVLFLIPRFSTLACSCIPVSLEGEVERRDVIFCGTIEKMERYPEFPEDRKDEDIRVPHRSFYKATFRVSQPLKGNLNVNDLVEIYAYPDGAACGIRLNFHEPYIVYASMGEIGLSTGLCSRSRIIDSYSPMRPNESYEEWKERREEYKREIEEEILLIPAIVEEQNKSNQSAHTTPASAPR